MHIEVALFDLVLMLPLTAEEERRLPVMEEGLSDGEQEVRELGHQWANDNNQPGLGQVDGNGSKAIEDVVRSFYWALDSVTEQEMADYDAAFLGDE